jgi:hypothetical protein
LLSFDECQEEKPGTAASVYGHFFSFLLTAIFIVVLEEIFTHQRLFLPDSQSFPYAELSGLVDRISKNIL